MPDEALSAAWGGGLLALTALLGRLPWRLPRWLAPLLLLLGAAGLRLLPDPVDLPTLLPLPAALAGRALLARLAPSSPLTGTRTGGPPLVRLRAHLTSLVSPLGSSAAVCGFWLDAGTWLLLTVPPLVMLALVSRESPPDTHAPLPGGLLAAGTALLTRSSAAGWMAGRGYVFLVRRVPEEAVLGALSAVSSLLSPGAGAAFVASIPWPPGPDPRVAAVTLLAVASQPLQLTWQLRRHPAAALAWLLTSAAWLMLAARWC